MDGNPVLSHIGYVVDSRASVGATAVSEVFQDPIQKARLIFLDLPTPAWYGSSWWNRRRGSLR